MQAFKCIKSDPLEESYFIEGAIYFLEENNLFNYTFLEKTLLTEEDWSWFRDSFVPVDRTGIIEAHFDGLYRIKTIAEILDEKGKEVFIQNYPISCFDFVSTRRFWNACYEVGLVEHHWSDEEKNEGLEQELFDELWETYQGVLNRHIVSYVLEKYKE